MNEVSYHLLEATTVHLHFTRGPLGGASAGAGAGAAATNGGAVQQAGDGGYGGHDAAAQFGPVAKNVFNFLRTELQGNEGTHQQVIAARLGLDTAQVASAGEQLLGAGLIYTTVDDFTWAILEAD
jgi:replication factor A2